LGLLPDLKAQVQHWIKWEQQREISDTDTDDEVEEVIFTISFGFWDMWQYATLELKEAENAIKTSVYTLFQQMDFIAEHCAVDPRFVITGLWDITFSPHFQSLSLNATAPHFGEAQHKMIYLVSYWNSALYSASNKFGKGDIFIVDWQSWVMEQIRLTQMDALKLYDTAAGPIKPAFDDVTTPCFVGISAADNLSPQTNAGKPERCEKPERNLFW
jgi:hypothetical protein